MGHLRARNYSQTDYIDSHRLLEYITLKDIQEGSTNPGKMARGQQKIQSQQKAQEKQAKLKKQAGQSAASRTATAAVGLKMSCKVCMAQMPDPKTYKQHFENKHSKMPLPDDLKDV